MFILLDISKGSPSPFGFRKGSEPKAPQPINKKDSIGLKKPNIDDKKESVVKGSPALQNANNNIFGNNNNIVMVNNQNIFKSIASEVLKNPFAKKLSNEEMGNPQPFREPQMRDFKSVHRIRKGAPLEMVAIII